jgi:hypothetical protein
MVVGLSEESSTVSDVEVQTKTSVLAKQAAGYLNAGY